MLFIGGEWDGHRADIRPDSVAYEVRDIEGEFFGRELYEEELEDREGDRYFLTELNGVEVMLAEGMDAEDATLRLIENYPS